MASVLAALRRFRARWALIRPRLAWDTVAIRMSRLPPAVRCALDGSHRTVEPYVEVSKYWHDHAIAFAPDYGAYAVLSRLLGRQFYVFALSPLVR